MFEFPIKFPVKEEKTFEAKRFPVRAKSPTRTFEMDVSPKASPMFPNTFEFPTMFPVRVPKTFEAQKQPSPQ